METLKMLTSNTDNSPPNNNGQVVNTDSGDSGVDSTVSVKNGNNSSSQVPRPTSLHNDQLPLLFYPTANKQINEPRPDDTDIGYRPSPYPQPPIDGYPPPVAISGRTSDRPTLLAFMYIRFREKKHTYTYSSTFYRRLDMFLFFMPLMGLQCSVAVVYVAANDNEEFQRVFSGCVSAISAVLIAIQMKLKWGEMAEQFQGGARQYSLLASETFFKWLTASTMNESDFQEFVKDTGQLEKEIQDTTAVPPAWITSKFEQHRLQLTITNDSGTQISPAFFKGDFTSSMSRSNNRSRTTSPRRSVPNARANSGGTSATSGEQDELLGTDFSTMIQNLPPPDDLNPPPAALFPAKSRLRMSRPSGLPAFEMSPIPEHRTYHPSQQQQPNSPTQSSVGSAPQLRYRMALPVTDNERMPFIDSSVPNTPMASAAIVSTTTGSSGSGSIDNTSPQAVTALQQHPVPPAQRQVSLQPTKIK